MTELLIDKTDFFGQDDEEDMLTKNDLQQIRDVIREEVPVMIRKEIRKELKTEFEAQAVLLQHSFQDVQNQFVETNSRIDNLHNSVDGFLKKITRVEDEYEAVVKQMARRDTFYPLPQA